MQLGPRIGEIHAEFRGSYGWPRAYAQLRRDGHHLGRKWVARIMRQATLSEWSYSTT